jgi:hypothetical protein
LGEHLLPPLDLVLRLSDLAAPLRDEALLAADDALQLERPRFQAFVRRAGGVDRLPHALFWVHDSELDDRERSVHGTAGDGVRHLDGL